MKTRRPASYRPLAIYAWRERRRLAATLVFTGVLSLLAAAEPLPLKLVIDNALGGEPLPPFLIRLLQQFDLQPESWLLVVMAALVSLLILMTNAVLIAAVSWLWAFAGQRMVIDLTTDLFARLQRLSLQFHRQRPLGDSLSRLTSDTWSVYSFTAILVAAPIREVFTFASVGIVAWTLDARLTLFCVGMAPLLGFSSWWFGERLKARAKQGREAQADVLSFLQQIISSIPLVQAFRAEERNRLKFNALAGRSVAADQKGALLTGSYGMVNAAIVTLGTSALLYVGGLRVVAGTLPLGTLLVFLAYGRTLQKSVEGLLNVYASLKPLEASMERVAEVLSSSESLPEAADAQPLPKSGEGSLGYIQFKNVTFGYQPGRPVLQDVSLELRPGEVVALVGHTGAGKSTLASLLPRFHDPQLGSVLFDGVDLRQLQLRSLRSQIALVLQDSLLLPISVADNISYGRPEATREQIVSAAAEANADEFIQRLPAGYDTVLAEGGATFSGGERQRLAIARAILRDAQVLILDEPTSALDERNEALLMAALDRLMSGRTTLIVAHRLSTIRKAHTIVVMDHGRIVERGSHEELIAAHGRYEEFWRMQSFDSWEDVA